MRAPRLTLTILLFLLLGTAAPAWALEEWAKMTQETPERIEALLQSAAGLVVEVPVDDDGVEIVDLSRFGVQLKGTAESLTSLVQLRRFGGQGWGLYGMPRPPIRGYVNFSSFQPRFDGASRRYIFEPPVFIPGPGYHRYFYPLAAGQSG